MKTMTLNSVKMVFNGELLNGMPRSEYCISRKCCLWPWPLNSWPWKCHQH